MQHQIAHEEIFRRLHEIEQKLQYIERREQDGWRAITTQTNHIVDNSRSSTTIVGNLEIKLAKDIQYIEERASHDIQAEVTKRTESEARLRAAIADEAHYVKQALENAERTRSTEFDGRIADLSDQLSQLARSLETRLGALSTQLGSAVESAKHDATLVEERLSQHKAAREAAEMNILTVLEETCVQLHQEIVSERQERQESHKRLERLLLDVSRRQWVRT